MGARRSIFRHLSRLAMMSLLLSATALGVAGCSGGGSESPKGGTLTGARWVLASYLADGSQVQVPAGVTSDATFADDRVSGNGGVNQYSGPYKAESNGTISFGDIAATLMAGPPANTTVESAVFAGFKASTSYYADDTTLTLYDKDDNAVLTYDKPVKATLEGTPWLVTNYNNGKEAIVSVSGGVDLTATFGEDGTVTGFGGVNNYNGPYKVDGKSIEIGPLASTKMAGDPALMEQETLFLVAMQSAATYVIVGEKMELHTADGPIAVKLIRQ